MLNERVGILSTLNLHKFSTFPYPANTPHTWPMTTEYFAQRETLVAPFMNPFDIRLFKGPYLSFNRQLH